MKDRQIEPRSRPLGFETRSQLELAAKVEAGLPYSAFESLREFIDLKASDAAEFVRIPYRTLRRRQKSGRLNPEESDHLVRASRIVDLATRLFEGDKDQARHWLQSPKRALGDRTPIDLARTDVGAREVERLIDRLEHGVLT